METMTNPTANLTAGPTTVSRSSRRRRHAVRIGGLVLAASSIVGGLADAAMADTPPAPQQPKMELAQAEPGKSPHKVSEFASSAGDTWMDVTFRSTAPKVVVQLSTAKPTIGADGTPSLPTNPQYLTGKAVGGGMDQLANSAPVYEYKLSREGLTPDTQHYLLVTLPGSGLQTPNYFQTSRATKRRFVKVTPLSVHVIDDADGAFRGAGELYFATRVAPDGDALGFGAWGSWTKELKLNSGASATLPTGLWQVVQTKQSHAVIQMQGRELDGSYGACPWEAGGFAPTTASNSCWDFGVASAVVSGPTGRYQGVDTKVVDVKVGRDPSLKFDAKVRVETWYA
ncbi:MAG: hypothetical protein KDB33_17120 [Acidimicrobiales bacterium]|nr:hypothetical protein [Acidimicrobiales bacterium]